MGRFTITEIEPTEHYRTLAWCICILGASFYCYEYFLRIAPSVMFTNLVQTFHLNAGQFGELNAFFYYAYTPMQLIVGVLMDKYGPRRLLMVACLACAAGAFIFSGTHIFIMAAMGRFLMGFGAAFAFVGALKLATIWLPPERFAAVSGMITSLGMLGAMFGDVFMTEIVEKHGWRFTILFWAYAGVILMILIFMFVRDRVKTTRKTPIFIPELSFKDVFVGLLQALRNRNIWINGLIGCLMYLPITVFAELWGIPYLTQTYHLSHIAAATIGSTIFLGWAIGGPLVGWISDLIQLRRLPMMIGAIFGLIIISVILYVPDLTVSMLYILFFLLGLATSVQVLIFAVGREVSPKHIAATAISLTNMFTMIGGAIFQPVVGMLLDSRWQGHIVHGAHVYTSGTFSFALSILPMALLITVVLTFFLKETHGHLVS